MNEQLILELLDPNEEKVTNEVIKILESRGFKITRPPKPIKDEYTFENAWNLYQKKVGCKDKLEKKWNSMSLKDRKAATEYIPLYVMSTEDKKYRKNFQTFLNQRAWEDELIGAAPPPKVTNEQPSEISLLLQKTKTDIAKREDGTSLRAERKRILGLIELVKRNPESSARLSLMGYYKRGYLQELGINWQP